MVDRVFEVVDRGREVVARVTVLTDRRIGFFQFVGGLVKQVRVLVVLVGARGQEGLTALAGHANGKRCGDARKNQPRDEHVTLVS